MAVHDGTFGTVEAVVVSLVEDDAFNGESCEWVDGAGIATAGSVMIHGGAGAKVGWFNAIGGDFLALFFHVGDPVMMSFDSVFEVCFGVPCFDLFVPIGEQ